MEVMNEAAGTVYSVRNFGAAGDGDADDTRAIQSAIDACGLAGGGTVYVPSGIYFCAALELRSYVTLYLEANSRLLISPGPEGYPKPGPECYVRTLGSNCERIFLHGNRVERAALRGAGVIDGRLGSIDDADNSWEGITILFEQSADVLVEGIEIVKAPNWTLAFYGCRDVKALHLKILDSCKDGINPVCCQNVLIDGVYIRGTGDDPICIKNESPGYLYETRPDCGYLSENIIVANTVVEDTHGHPAVKIGTGTAGVFRNIIVHDCVFSGTGAAFCIQLVRPDMEETERVIENVRLSNLVVRNCDGLMDITELDVSRPIIRNLSMQNVTAQGMRRFSRILGTQEAPVGRVSLRDIFFDRTEAMDYLLEAAHVDGLSVEGLTVEGTAGSGPRRAILLLEDCRRVRAGGISGDGTLLALKGADTENVLFHDDGAGRLEPLDIAADVPNGVVLPRTARFQIESLEGPESVMPGESIEGTLRVRNEGETGFWWLAITVDGAALSWVRAWLRRDEVRTIPFSAGPLYLPGVYSVDAGGRTFRTEVLFSGADIRISPRIEVAGEGKRLEFKLRARNTGGAPGEKAQELRCSGEVLEEGTFRLDPGREGELVLKTDGGTGEGPWLLPGITKWDYRLAANTFSRYQAEGNRITITGGGRQYTSVGDFEKENLMEYAALYKRVRGDFTATVKLVSQEASGQYAFAGLIVCNDMSHARQAKGTALLTCSPKYGSMGLWRADCDGDGRTEAIEYGSMDPGDWIRIEKTGKQFQAFVGRDRENWTVWGVWQVDAAEEEQDVGLFVYANSVSNKTGRAEFEDLEIENKGN